jgi:hypothetical protein
VAQGGQPSLVIRGEQWDDVIFENNSERSEPPVIGTRVLEILCVKNRPERPLKSVIAKAHSQKPNCSTPSMAKKSKKKLDIVPHSLSRFLNTEPARISVAPSA